MFRKVPPFGNITKLPPDRDRDTTLKRRSSHQNFTIVLGSAMWKLTSLYKTKSSTGDMVQQEGSDLML